MTGLLWLLLMLAPVALALGVLAYFQRVYPHRPLVLAALVPGLLSLGLFYELFATRRYVELTESAVFWPLVAADLAIVAVAALDLWSLPRRQAFSAERQVGRIASLQKPHAVALVLVNHGRRGLFVQVRDDVPPELAAEPDEFRLRLGPRSRTSLRYQLLAARRGAYVLPAVHLRARSGLGFWRRYFTLPVASQVHVYPDLKQLGEYALLARSDRLSLVGVKRSRKIGQDNEFERLRDYTLDDSFKHMDWRSSARRQKLTVKDFQANQSQRLVFLLDCGRMMTNESSGLTLLDHALNSVLMLSYVALSHGDSVGMICFSDEIHAFTPPRGGMQQMNRLLHASFDRFPRLVESRYDQAFLYLGAHCRKRSLVVLLTNVIDEVNANQVHRYLSNIVGRHLPLGVLLRDRQMFEAVETPQPQGAALYRAAAAAEILGWRQQVLSDLQNRGVLALDVFPENLTAPLVNRYLDAKARHLL